jgi:hypothetical protein
MGIGDIGFLRRAVGGVMSGRVGVGSGHLFRPSSYSTCPCEFSRNAHIEGREVS